MSTHLPTGNPSLTRGRVVLVSFPFDDLSTSKVRPAVCLTDEIGPHRHVVLAFISSRPVDDGITSDLLLDPGHRDFGRTGLRMRSTLRLHRLVTVSVAVVRRELGELSPDLLGEVDQRLRVLFKL